MLAPVIIRMGHGPDADDAFVFEPLIHGRVDTEGLEFVHEHLPFHALNEGACGDDPPEVTMLSSATLARQTRRWMALPFGGSFVHTMGPTLVARHLAPLREFEEALVAIPGPGTTAALLLELALPGVRTVVVHYEEIAAAVAAGRVDAGVVIHEGQIDYVRHGLVAVTDLGLRWKRLNDLPTPLAVCAVRADLPQSLRDRVVRVLRRSIEEARADPEPALAYAAGFAGDNGPDVVRRLVEEYVREDTYGITETGRRAIHRLVSEAQALVRQPELEFADTL